MKIGGFELWLESIHFSYGLYSLFIKPLMSVWHDARCLGSMNSGNAHIHMMWGLSAFSEGHTASQLLLLSSGWQWPIVIIKQVQFVDITSERRKVDVIRKVKANLRGSKQRVTFHLVGGGRAFSEMLSGAG